MRRAGANEQRRLRFAQPGWLAIKCAETGLSSQYPHYSSLDQAESLLSAALQQLDGLDRQLLLHFDPLLPASLAWVKDK